jgi:hypothetical protein
MNKRFVSELAELFHRHGLIDWVDPKNIDTALEQPFLGYIVRQLLPQRLLVYDVECIEMDEDIAQLVMEYSEITLSEWQPKSLSSKLLREKNLGTVGFDFDGKHFAWEFQQDGTYIDPELPATINAFAEDNLSGTYLDLQSMSQEAFVVYLPKTAANAFEKFIESFTLSSDEIAEFIGTIDDLDNKGLSG